MPDSATIDSVRSTVSTATARVAAALTTLAVVVGLVGWSAFWSNLARLNYAQGDLLSALFTAATLVAPGIWALVWYVGESAGADVPAPTVGPSVSVD
ncbi:hypothetical protein JCM30237_08190 [Halolamina litorea]|uniref:Uncharacterized protein n=1 Tax=Halolamina litorea TaxID=1515593 RepID=A0ABD6BQE4_9EURY|nr:hypothetical protein [Halolamina litorea]